MSYALVVAYAYSLGIPFGMLLADDAALRDIEEALEITERSSEDFALGWVRFTLGVALMYRELPAEREHGLAVLGQVCNMCLEERFYQFALACVSVYAAQERARRGDRDGAIRQMRTAIDDLFHAGYDFTCIPGIAFLVEMLLERGCHGDVAEAENAIDRSVASPADEGLMMHDVWLLRMRVLLARALRDEIGYRDQLARYRAMAKSLGFEGHIEWAAVPVGIVGQWIKTGP